MTPDLKQVFDMFWSALDDEEREAFGLPKDPASVAAVLGAGSAALEYVFDERTEPQSPVGGGRDLMLCLPHYKSVCPQTLFSLMALWDRAKMRCIVQYGDAFIVHTRNVLAQRFLQSDCEWALFVDDDMVLPTGNANWFNTTTGFSLPPGIAGRNAVNRLREAGKTLVGGFYVGRSSGRRPMFAEGLKNPLLAKQAARGVGQVTPTEWVGTGCLLVHRSVFTAIQEKFPHLAPKVPDGPWEFFSPSPDEVIRRMVEAASAKTTEAMRAGLQQALALLQAHRFGTGEDVAFCRRAKSAGHQPHVDLGLVCGHLGTYCYGASTGAAEPRKK